MLWTGLWMSKRCISFTPIRLDLLQTANLWYLRGLDPDTVQNGNIYFSIKEAEVFIYLVFEAVDFSYERDEP